MIYLYEEDSGDDREITAGSIGEAKAQARTWLIEGVQRQFAATREDGKTIDVREVTVSAEVTPELPDTTLDAGSRQQVKVTIPVPGDLFDDSWHRA